jgi:hypothetical protein
MVVQPDLKMKTYTAQYKLLFYLSWICLYLIFPAWALPISTISRLLVFLGLLAYFSISLYILSYTLQDLNIDKSFIDENVDYRRYLKHNSALLIICGIAIVLHLYPISFPILVGGDEATHLQGGLGIYTFFDKLWSKHIDIPIQYISWLVVAIMSILLAKRNSRKYFKNRIACLIAGIKNNKFWRFFSPFSVFLLLAVFFYILRDLPYRDAFTRFPPVAKLLYLTSYFFLGITHTGPRFLQVLFSVLGTIYLYRAIDLFRDKETALLGAGIYLFSPIIFCFANLAEVACGTIFFVILISFHFLRFIKNNEDNDLILTSFFIGLGFLYKRSIFLMLFVCIGYLILSNFKNRNSNLGLNIKVLLISLAPIIPWLIIGKIYAWRKYEIIWSNLLSHDTLLSYMSMIPSQISWVVFIIFLISIIFAVVKKRDDLTFYFGFLFIAYYLFYTADLWTEIHRFSMVFYPVIAVFVAQLIASIVRKIRWKHSFKLASGILLLYLILICTVWQVPPLYARFVTYKNIESRYFPCDKAMLWVKDNVKDGEKVLVIRVTPAAFYRDKYGIDREKIIEGSLRDYSSTSELLAYCRANKVTHLMISNGPADKANMKWETIKYLKDNNAVNEEADFNLDGNHIYVFKILTITDKLAADPRRQTQTFSSADNGRGKNAFASRNEYILSAGVYGGNKRMVLNLPEGHDSK